MHLLQVLELILWLLESVEFIVCFPCLLFRFNISFEEITDAIDGSDEERDAARPCFTAIDKSTGFLDRELAASGFTRKDEDDIQKV